jgi:hypothetical protein
MGLMLLGLILVLIFFLVREINQQLRQPDRVRSNSQFDIDKYLRQWTAKARPNYSGCTGLRLPRHQQAASRNAQSRHAQSISHETQKKLLTLLNGDATTAQRLLKQVRITHPGRSEQWCWEKVIYDLERDRRV